MPDLSTIFNATNIAYIMLLAGVMAGGFVAFRSSTKTALLSLKNETITAYQQRLEVIENKVRELETENLKQRTIIETIQAALKQKGMIITIDGDLVTIQENNSTTSSMKRRTARQAAKKSEEE